MVTVDEYLQLRAILAKAPGAKLYVFKNQFDDGYSLELRFGNHEPAIANGLHIHPSPDNIASLILELNGGPGLFMPISITRKTDQMNSVGSFDGVTINHGNGFSAEVLSIRSDELLTNGVFGDHVKVYVNRERVGLVKRPNHKVSVKLNGTDISNYGADEWAKVIVEGRPQPTPQQRTRVLLGLPATPIGPESSSIQSAHQEEGTYRKWYDGLRHLKDQPVRAYYNDREVSLDFLLDTEFGGNAIITHGINFETNMGKYALQVIDDAPVPDGYAPKTALSYDFTFDAEDFTKVDLYFRRLPTPAENRLINQHLTGFPGIDLRVFQDCKNEAGDYTLYFGDASGKKSVSSILADGEVQNQPVRFSLGKDEQGLLTIKSDHFTQGPREAAASEVYLVIDGIFINIYAGNAKSYTKANLDPVPDATALKCILSNLTNSSSLSDVSGLNFWSGQNRLSWNFHSKSYQEGLFEGLHSGLEKAGFGDRSIVYYINDRQVSIEDFSQYKGGKNARVRMGTWSNIDDAPVILEIVD